MKDLDWMEDPTLRRALADIVANLDEFLVHSYEFMTMEQVRAGLTRLSYFLVRGQWVLDKRSLVLYHDAFKVYPNRYFITLIEYFIWTRSEWPSFGEFVFLLKLKTREYFEWRRRRDD